MMTQSGCVGMVMSAVNAREIEDRQALKRWFAKDAAYADCETPMMIAPVSYYDFDGKADQKQELVVDASSCMAGTAGADIHAVLTPTVDGGFLAWDIPEISAKQLDAAKMEGSRNYRLSVKDGMLVATWHDRSGRSTPPMVVTYKPVGGDKRAFALYAVVYGQ